MEIRGPFFAIAGEDLEAKRRVKIDTSASATAGKPVVVYADAGEDFIGITEFSIESGGNVTLVPITEPGLREVEVTIDSAIAIGTVLYGAADGKLSDASSGSAQGIAMQAAAADNDHITCSVWSVKSTTAATVSIADSGGFTSQVTVEAALAEIYQDLLSAQVFIPIPLTTLMESDGTNTVAYLGPATTPILDMANGDTDSGLLVTWAATDQDPVIAEVPLPPDLDVTAAIVLHMRVKMSDTNNTPTIASDSYFNEGDTKVEDVSAALDENWTERTITIAAADVPAGAQTLTVELTPGAHANDALYMSALWAECTRVLRTS